MDQRTNRRAFDRRVSLVLKKCVESLDRAKIGQKKKEETRSGGNEKIKPPDTLGQKRTECPDSFGNESFSGHKKIGERVDSPATARDDGVDQKKKEQFDLSPVETANTALKKKEPAEPSTTDTTNHKKITERTDLFVSDISQNLQERPKKINLHTSNIRKWSNAVETMRTMRRYIKNEGAETDELLIGYMLSIDFPLLQAMYKFIRMVLPGTSEIAELDALTKDKILIAMDAIELWDKKRKKLSVPDFVNDLFAQVSSIEGFIKNLLGKASDDSDVEPVMLALMAHAFGLRIESKRNVTERTRLK